MNTIELVREFHDAFGVETPERPSITNEELNKLRVRLHMEEAVVEFSEALRSGDAVAVLDALCDAQVVIDGSFLALGFSSVKDAAFAEVHRSNMSKLGLDGKPIKREDGKVLKGPNYYKPNLSQFINKDTSNAH